MTRQAAEDVARSWIMRNRHRIITPAACRDLAELLLKTAQEARANEAEAQKAANGAWYV